MYARPDRHADQREARAGTQPRAPLWHRVIAGLMKAVLPILVLVAAANYAGEIFQGAPEAGRREGVREARLVETARVGAAASGPVIRGFGTVAPARRLVLSSEIGGRVRTVSPKLTEGALVPAGAVLLTLDERDIALEIAEADAEIARIEAQILIEAGQQSRAARDLERNPVRRDITEAQRALILREPQMADLEAQRRAAEARLERARLRLDKATITAPFDAVVEAEAAAEGAVLAAGQEVARLVAADRVHVMLSVPPQALAWIATDGSQSARLSQPGVWPDGMGREARVLRLSPGLSETGRMAELILEVEDPLARGPAAGAPRLLLDSLLEAEIVAPAIPGAVEISRGWLREGARVWVASGDRLEIREVEIAWQGRDTVLVSAGLAPGERVITSRLRTVADGMAIRTAAEAPRTAELAR